MKPIRLIDAGSVSYLRSQALYHGLAYARTEQTPDTVVLATPRVPYVCIGLHQDLEREVDVDYCARHGVPVVRRETGGGAVYLDDQQLFVQWVMAPGRLPARVEARFVQFCAPLIATYREFGVAAEFRPVNDVQVGGRKVSGTGAAQIGTAEVLTGNFLFDFDTARMARVIRSPSEAFADQVERSLRRYMSSFRRELGTAPAQAEVRRSYARHCERALGRELVPGELGPDELRAIEASEHKLGSSEFLRQSGGLRRPGLKIHQDVHVAERLVEHGAAIVRLTARLRCGRIERLVVTGDAGCDRTWAAAVVAALEGVVLQPEPVRRALEHYNSSCVGVPERAPLELAAWMQALLDFAQPIPISSASVPGTQP